MRFILIFILLGSLQADASVVKELAAYIDHTSVAPASSLETWGVEFGMIGGATNSHEVSTSNIDRLIGRLTFPHSITLEAGSSFVTQWSAALQWTFTDEVWMLRWFDAALKLKYAHGRVVNSDVNFDDAICGAEIFVSKKLSVWEPFLAVGFAKAEADPQSAQMRVGISFYPFPFLDLSAEYVRSFDVDSWFVKVAFQAE